MDKETQKKIYNDLRTIHETDWQDYVDAVVGVMEANGYRKPLDRPELREKIAEARLTYIILNWRDNLDNTMMTSQELAQTLLKVLTEEFGYHKLPEGKPPLVKLNKDEDPSLYSFAEGAQAQRVADIKWYKGGSNG